MENCESYYDYNAPYSNTGATRINGNNDWGIAFTNTTGVTTGTGTGANDTTSRRLGIAVLALNTSGRTAINVAWVGRTVASGLTTSFRVYGMTLQYRVGSSGAWTTLHQYLSDNSKVITYTNSSTYTSQSFSGQLPSFCENQPLVQLRWVYHNISGSGSRPALAFDDVNITSYDASGVPTALAMETKSPEK